MAPAWVWVYCDWCEVVAVWKWWVFVAPVVSANLSAMVGFIPHPILTKQFHAYVDVAFYNKADSNQLFHLPNFFWLH